MWNAVIAISLAIIASTLLFGPGTTKTLLVVGVIVLVIGNLLYWWRSKRRGDLGLDQWPEPYGRYYDEWCKLPVGHGDYYEWLAKKKGYREPWATWAALDADGKTPTNGQTCERDRDGAQRCADHRQLVRPPAEAARYEGRHAHEPPCFRWRSGPVASPNPAMP